MTGELDYKVKLEVFEGPLDLLLYLIRKEEVDVRDIPVSRITEQYLQYLDLMRELNLDVAGEFILMAATLAHIKSRELLPRDPTVVADEEEEGDPRAELVRRLLEYQKYKEAAGDLGGRPLLNRDTFPRGEANVPGKELDDLDAAPPDAPLEISLFALLGAFKRVIEGLAHRGGFHEVARDSVSVADKARAMAATLSAKGKILFTELFVDASGKMDVIATFLALLEMVRMKLVRVNQALDSEEIQIESQIPEGLDVGSVLNGTGMDKAFAYGVPPPVTVAAPDGAGGPDETKT